MWYLLFSRALRSPDAANSFLTLVIIVGGIHAACSLAVRVLTWRLMRVRFEKRVGTAMFEQVWRERVCLCVCTCAYVLFGRGLTRM